jgi:nitrile hydratase
MFQVLRHTATRPGEMRYALERLAPDDYFDHGGYYGRWEAVMELLLEEYALLAPGELDVLLGAKEGTGPAHRASPVAPKDPQKLPADRKTPQPNHRTVRRELAEPPLFGVGDRVVALGVNQTDHTRLPEYVTGVPGTVIKIHPAEVLPDSTAHDLGERAQHVFCVGYHAEDLWGNEAEAGVVINVDLYENYLTAVGEAV